MTPQELKSSILQLAIQGRLVEQRPEEGTGEELYQEIQAEKRRLIKAGKIKREKPLPEITEDDIPFDIPENWKWVRVGSITSLNPKNILDNNINVAFIPMPCVADGFRNQHTFEVRKWQKIKKGFTHFSNGDIGIAKITPCFQNRKSVIFKELENGCGAGSTELSIVRAIENTLIREYLLWFFKTDYFIVNGVKSFAGTAGQQRIHKDFLKTCLIPLPPLAEQKRIVARIEELLPYIDRYEQAWSKLEEFNKRFPDDMQKSLLQYAIQGKLVEQRPEEGTAEELYQQIQIEKQKLIKEGKIKKDKPLPEITEDEKPFEIPEGWMWVHLDDVVVKPIKRGKSPTYTAHSNTLVFAQKCNTKAGKIDLSLALFLDETKLSKYPNSEFMVDDDIVINSTGNGTLGRVGLYKNSDNPNGIPVVPDSHVTIIRASYNLCVKYTFYCLKYYQPYMEKLGSGSTNQTELSANTVRALLFPLPPLAEQKRVVAKLEELLPLCEKLKK